MIFSVILLTSAALGMSGRLLESLCNDKDFSCISVKRGESWDSLFPNENFRKIVMELNRINIPLHRGMTIAVPKESEAQLNDFSPFSQRIKPLGNKLLIFDPSLVAWVAYSQDGNLLRWGAASGGSQWCPDLGRPCRTRVGVHQIYTMQGRTCRSRIFPLHRGGAPMPYCMYFFKGQAFHGAPYELPGFNASHGCIRIFVDDAQWLYNNFVKVGTTVIVKPYSNLSFSKKHIAKNNDVDEEDEDDEDDEDDDDA